MIEWIHPKASINNFFSNIPYTQKGPRPHWEHYNIGSIKIEFHVNTKPFIFQKHSKRILAQRREQNLNSIFGAGSNNGATQIRRRWRVSEAGGKVNYYFTKVQ